MEIRELYEELYRACGAEVLNGSGHFVCMRGPFDGENTRRLMLIGIAPNGWGQLNTASPEAFGDAAQRQFDDLTRWSWIRCRDGALYNSGDYCISQKPFWTYAEAVWRGLPGEAQDRAVWMENIAWSNLYKLSPLSGYNPDRRLAEMQREVCREILRKELALCRPTHILLCTGWDQFAPFADLFDGAEDTGRRNVMRGSRKNTVYVEGTAYFQNARAVITCRPEFRDKAGFADAVLRAFQKR